MRLSALIVASLLLLGDLQAGALAAPPPPVLTPFVWRVEAPDAAPGEVDHLIGTIHVALRPGERLAPAATELAARAERFLMEVDLSTVTADLVGRHTRLPDPDGLRRLLPADTWEAVLRRCEAQQLSPDAVRGLKPWYAALLLVPAQAPAEELVDSRLLGAARAARVPTGFLETAEAQLEALDAVSDEEDLKQLREVLADPTRAERELGELEAAYRAGDLPALERYLFAPDRVAAYPDFYEHVFHARNRRWLPAIERHARQERACVAVGLGHLVGDRGVLAMLAARGWRIRRGP